MLEPLSDDGAAELASRLTDEPWIHEALTCPFIALELEPCGWWALSDDDALWPSRVCRVTRIPWRAGDGACSTYLALHAKPRGDRPPKVLAVTELPCLNPAYWLNPKTIARC